MCTCVDFGSVLWASHKRRKDRESQGQHCESGSDMLNHQSGSKKHEGGKVPEATEVTVLPANDSLQFRCLSLQTHLDVTMLGSSRSYP